MRKSRLFIAIFLIIALFIITILIYLRTTQPKAATQTNVRAQNASDEKSIEEEINQKLAAEVTKNTNDLSPYERLKVDQFVEKLPYSSPGFNIVYSQELNQIVMAVRDYADVDNMKAYLAKENVLTIYLRTSPFFHMDYSTSTTLLIKDRLDKLKNEVRSQVVNERKSNVQGIITGSASPPIAALDAEAQNQLNSPCPDTYYDPDEPCLPDSSDLISIVDLFKDLVAFGEPEKTSTETATLSNNDGSDEEAEQEDNGQVVFSNDTTGIQCQAGTDLGPAEGWTKGNRVRIRLCRVQGIQVNSQISGRVDTLLTTSKRDGLDLITGSGGYRSMDGQIAARKRNGCPADPNQPSSTCRVPTARPGWSNHQMGFAIDFDCSGVLIGSHSNKCFQWLVNNQSTHQLINFSKEPWHWSLDGK